MPQFTYTFRNYEGRTEKGVLQALNEEQLRKRLFAKGITPDSVRLDSESSAVNNKLKVNLGVLTVFCRQFSTMIDAGVPLVKALRILTEQTDDKNFKIILQDLSAKVEEGESLSNAMELYPRVFSTLFVGLVRSGEVGGVLDKVLDRLAEFLEKEVKLRRKVKSSMTYPIIVLTASLAVVIFLISYIVPKFVELFENMNMEHDSFPAATQFLINLSNTINNSWPKLLFGTIICIFTFRWWSNTHSGKRAFDRLKLKLPVFGTLTSKVILSRFSRTLGTLLGSGVPILQALETVAGTVNNILVSEEILRSRDRITAGESLSYTISSSPYFPPIVVHMIQVGEESGSLDFMLHKIADFYDDEVDTALASLTAALEPLLILILAVVVGFIVIAMFMPSLQVMNGLSEGAMG